MLRARNPPNLLAPGLANLVEPGTIEKFSKNKRHLGRDNARTIIFDNNPENIR